MSDLTTEDLDDLAEDVPLSDLTLEPLPSALVSGPSTVYPVYQGIGWYRFSDGSAERCSEERALDIEAEIRDPLLKAPQLEDT